MRNQILSVVSLIVVALFAFSGCSTGSAREAGMPGYERSTGEAFDDSVILSKVKAELLRDPEVSGLNINVNVFNRVVTLKGFVKQESEAIRAIELAEGVRHVARVNSKLVIDDGGETL